MEFWIVQEGQESIRINSTKINQNLIFLAEDFECTWDDNFLDKDKMCILSFDEFIQFKDFRKSSYPMGI